MGGCKGQERQSRDGKENSLAPGPSRFSNAFPSDRLESEGFRVQDQILPVVGHVLGKDRALEDCPAKLFLGDSSFLGYLAERSGVGVHTSS